jgi:hypothetical protein
MKHCIALSGSILFKPIWNVRSCSGWLHISISTCHVEYPTVHSTRPFSTPLFVLSWCQHMKFAWKYVQNTFRNIYLQCAPILENNTTKKIHTLAHHRHVYYLKSATCFGLHEYLRDIIIVEENTVVYNVSASTLTRVRKIAKSDYYLRHACPSVRPHGRTRLPLEGFSWNSTFEDFSKICRAYSSFIKIGQE